MSPVASVYVTGDREEVATQTEGFPGLRQLIHDTVNASTSGPGCPDPCRTQHREKEKEQVRSDLTCAVLRVSLSS